MHMHTFNHFAKRGSLPTCCGLLDNTEPRTVMSTLKALMKGCLCFIIYMIMFVCLCHFFCWVALMEGLWEV